MGMVGLYVHTFIEILVAYQILRATNNLCIKFYLQAHVGRIPEDIFIRAAKPKTVQ